MSADDVAPVEDKELYHRGLGFLKHARGLRGLPPAAFDRIERRLERPRPARRRTWALAVATVAVVLLAGATIAVAHVGLRRLPLVGRYFAEPIVVPKPPKAISHAPSRPARLGGVIAPTTVEPATPEQVAGLPTAVAPEPAMPIASAPPVESPPSGERAASAPSRRPAAHAPVPTPTAVPTAASTASAILAESESFSEAVSRWHRDRDGRAALMALDAHERRFPAGRLMPESHLLRAEILLSEGREREGLAWLDRLTLAGSPRARELFTVRGELRIKHGRYRDGKADLDEVLASGVADELGRRAAAALRHCR